jgi:hypothetical protein
MKLVYNCCSFCGSSIKDNWCSNSDAALLCGLCFALYRPLLKKHGILAYADDQFVKNFGYTYYSRQENISIMRTFPSCESICPQCGEAH